ncbi:hypothetical protein K523DRAFT_79462 [Schizophyllum commune Tattone D]|nr:hypothetical protein K523DRAFT_79462 [Schizophyllum commune Tattone D]
MPFRVHGNPLVLLGIREEHTLDGEEKAHQSESHRRVQPISGIAAYTSPARAHDKMIELPTPLPVWQAVSSCHGACPLCLARTCETLAKVVPAALDVLVICLQPHRWYQSATSPLVSVCCLNVDFSLRPHRHEGSLAGM